MSSDQNDETGVPAGWELCVSKKNPSRKYYFNRRTGDSSWCKPQADTFAEESKSKNSKEENNKDKERKILKRKSDGGVSVSSSSSKKLKEDKPSLEKPSSVKSPVKKRSSTGSIKESPKFAVKKITYNSTPSRSPKPSLSPAKTARETLKARRSSQSPKATPTKNTANARLFQLRAELTADGKNEETKDKVLATKSTPDKKQEGQNESHSQNTHDPSDSAQAALSPSQFLTANKIIYAMKAQLPNRDAIKPKNAFADIEEGINNQTTEYPFMKHPATPPQFSEANKLMSAINSKLSYRKEPVETPIHKPVEPIKTVDTPTTVYNVFKSANMTENTYKSETPTAETNTYKSAKDRMEMFRKSLSTDVVENHNTGNEQRRSTEAMEVDPREIRLQPTPVPESKSVPVPKNNASSKENVILVVDTNIFIHELDFIKNIMNSLIEGYTEQPTLLVPWRVVNELDKLKDSNNGNGAICKRARPAMDYLYKSLPELNRIKVQPLRDANSHIYPCESPDDEILNCCLQQAERGKSVILLSNDKNLCAKAVANGVETKQLGALVLRPHIQSVASPAIVAHLKEHIYGLLSNILENEMRAKYDALWTRIVFLPPPWTLAGVLNCLLKHWIAVFNEVFPRIEYLIMDLKNSLGVIENKEPNTLSQSEVNNFKELCIELATRCQIIPEYMQLAKKTVEKLCGSESEDRQKSVDREIKKEGETYIIEAFEGIWSVFSSYCAKLATNLGIDHCVEDMLPGADSLDSLTSNLSIFGHHIQAIANALQGVLASAVNSPCFNVNIHKLEQAFKESLTHLGMDTKHATNVNIKIFSTKCRNMLLEAHSKFADLVTLLTICRNTLGHYT